MIEDVHAKIIIIILMIIFIIPCCTITIALKLIDSLSNTFFNFLPFKFNSLKYKLFKYLICTRKSLDMAKYFSYILQQLITRERRERKIGKLK